MRTAEDRAREAIAKIQAQYSAAGKPLPKALKVSGQKTIQPPLPCSLRGEATSQTVGCATCRGSVKLRLYTCNGGHGTCTLAKRVPGHGCCDAACKERPRDLIQLEVKPQLPAAPKPWENPVAVGEIPKLELTPTKPRAIVTFAANEYGRQMWSISGPFMEAYAKRLNADLVVLDWTGPAPWPMGCKFQIPQTLRFYDRIIYADADVLFRPGCVDLFALTPVGSVGGYSDLGEVLSKDPGFFAEFKRYREFMKLPGGPLHPIPWYLNTGILVLDRKHEGLLAVPTLPVPPIWCAEQHFWNASLLDSGESVVILPKIANWQWWPDPGWNHLTPPPEAVLHFSGMPDYEQRIAAMKKWSATG